MIWFIRHDIKLSGWSIKYNIWLSGRSIRYDIQLLGWTNFQERLFNMLNNYLLETWMILLGINSRLLLISVISQIIQWQQFLMFELYIIFFNQWFNYYVHEIISICVYIVLNLFVDVFINLCPITCINQPANELTHPCYR